MFSLLQFKPSVVVYLAVGRGLDGRNTVPESVGLLVEGILRRGLRIHRKNDLESKIANCRFPSFNSLFPCLAYIIDMYVRTEGAYGVNEGILSSAIAALTFALFSVQPLTIVGGEPPFSLSCHAIISLTCNLVLISLVTGVS